MRSCFDKTAERNWALGWHQDRTVVVRERKETDGYDPPRRRRVLQVDYLVDATPGPLTWRGVYGGQD